MFAWLATLRRAVANQGLNRFTEAKKDVIKVLSAEPNNKMAQVRKKCKEYLIRSELLFNGASTA